jgi:hypothetical protein
MDRSQVPMNEPNPQADQPEPVVPVGSPDDGYASSPQSVPRRRGFPRWLLAVLGLVGLLCVAAVVSRSNSSPR